MTRAERLARKLAPFRAEAKPLPPRRAIQVAAPKPRVELRSVVMNADDEEMPTDWLTLSLRPEYRVNFLAHWDERRPAGAPHYWRDYECYDLAPLASPALPPGCRYVGPMPGHVTGAVVEIEPETPRGFVARLLEKIGVHA